MILNPRLEHHQKDLRTLGSQPQLNKDWEKAAHDFLFPFLVSRKTDVTTSRAILSSNKLSVSSQLQENPLNSSWSQMRINSSTSFFTPRCSSLLGFSAPPRTHYR
uniref:Uncharacterized protein n=1 Tax=Utricularia reniformis TaxID=192314 RepID=A0A1Y0B112_9LAMI|nr:hypothetical protein AEK19_MT0846 [Utricularia reniformis]YP_009382291.1 hypothetical protein AEK19_MT1863 [Utricularia reniformis]ART31077.1 hypothetical protein AEK19_MT0846 [Utricularia reniformis]ART32034.1 hypothetical protein AEK19_MT1863 [Utricularia reniformis]